MARGDADESGGRGEQPAARRALWPRTHASPASASLSRARYRSTQAHRTTALSDLPILSALADLHLSIPVAAGVAMAKANQSEGRCPPPARVVLPCLCIVFPRLSFASLIVGCPPTPTPAVTVVVQTAPSRRTQRSVRGEQEEATTGTQKADYDDTTSCSNHRGTRERRGVDNAASGRGGWDRDRMRGRNGSADPSHWCC